VANDNSSVRVHVAKLEKTAAGEMRIKIYGWITGVKKLYNTLSENSYYDIDDGSKINPYAASGYPWVFKKVFTDVYLLEVDFGSAKRLNVRIKENSLFGLMERQQPSDAGDHYFFFGKIFRVERKIQAVYVGGTDSGELLCDDLHEGYLICTLKSFVTEIRTDYYLEDRDNIFGFKRKNPLPAAVKNPAFDSSNLDQIIQTQFNFDYLPVSFSTQSLPKDDFSLRFTYDSKDWYMFIESMILYTSHVKNNCTETDQENCKLVKMTGTLFTTPEDATNLDIYTAAESPDKSDYRKCFIYIMLNGESWLRFVDGKDMFFGKWQFDLSKITMKFTDEYTLAKDLASTHRVSGKGYFDWDATQTKIVPNGAGIGIFKLLGMANHIQLPNNWPGHRDFHGVCKCPDGREYLFNSKKDHCKLNAVIWGCDGGNTIDCANRRNSQNNIQVRFFSKTKGGSGIR
jgi:hypothetical protein